jgi:acyl-CoA thioester hydrolase
MANAKAEQERPSSGGMTKLELSKPFVSKTRVIYGDTDMMGVAYYANYLRWMEMGRNELIREKGMTYRKFEERGLILPVAEVEAKYLASAKYDDVIEVHTRVSEMGRVRVSFEYEVWRAVQPATETEPAHGERELLATGVTVHACLTKSDNKPTRIPDDVAALLRG